MSEKTRPIMINMSRVTATLPGIHEQKLCLVQTLNQDLMMLDVRLNPLFL